MKLNYIDIHSHLNLSPLYEKRDEIINNMKALAIGTITVGTSLETSQRAVQIAEQYPELCSATVGIHPCDCEKNNHETIDDTQWNQICMLAEHPSVVAIGETGLDYWHHDTPELRMLQTEVFKKHIELAISVNKPLMLHVRSSRGSDDAYYDALDILSEYQGATPSPAKGRVGVGFENNNKTPSVLRTSPPSQGANIRANFHFFSGSTECMQTIISAGYTVSVDGPITFVFDYDDMIKQCPIESLMIETDAPYAAPKPYRGKTCDPTMVIHVAERIAELKNLPLETIRLQLLENTKNFFGI